MIIRASSAPSHCLVQQKPAPATQRPLLTWLRSLSRCLQPLEMVVLIIEPCCNEECKRRASFGRQSIIDGVLWRHVLGIDEADWLADIIVRLGQEDRRTWA